MAASEGLRSVLALCEKRGFISAVGAGSEQDLGRRFQYGPLGTELKRNIVNEWWHYVVTSTGYVYPIDSPVLSSCKPTDVTEGQGTYYATPYHSMTESKDGDIHSKNRSTSNRTHTLRSQLNQAGLDTERLKILKPYGVAKVGTVFYDELEEETLFRTNEHDVCNLHFVCAQSEFKNWCSKWLKLRLRWWKKFSLHPEKFYLDKGSESAPFSFINYELPSGTCHLERSTTQTNSDKEPSISFSTFTDRAVLAYICDAYTKTSRLYQEKANGKSKEMLRFHTCLAPYKVAVFSKVSDNPSLEMFCTRLANELRQSGIATAGGIGGDPGCSYQDQLEMHDEMGTPFRVIADQSTLESGTVLLQDRDTTIEEVMNGQDVFGMLQRMLLRARLSSN